MDPILGPYHGIRPITRVGSVRLASGWEGDRRRLLAFERGPGAKMSIDEITRVHWLLEGVPLIPRVHARGSDRSAEWIAFDVAAEVDLANLLEGHDPERDGKIAYATVMTFVRDLFDCTIAIHARADPTTGEPVCLGFFSLSTLVVDSQLRTWLVAPGMRPAATGASSTLASIARPPELSVGGRATPGADVHAVLLAIRALWPLTELPPPLARALAGSPLAEDAAVTAKLAEAHQRILYSSVEARASAAEARELYEGVWRLLGLRVPDRVAQRSLLALGVARASEARALRADDDVPRPGDTIGGKYRVDACLGVGGMGVVVAATHLGLGQKVAIKLLRHTGEGAAGRLRREARTLGKLESAHAVRVLDVDEQPGGAPYVVMEHLEGRDLERELAERGRVAPAIALGWVLEALEAVGEAHALGIVHRDLKPANLFLAERADGSRAVKVLDFGIARLMSPDETRITRTGSFLGSPPYMAPEQWLGGAVDARTDVWAMGVVLHELLTGALPFECPTIAAACRAVLQDEPTHPSALVAGIDVRLDHVVLTCLRKEPDERWNDVGQLALALGEVEPRHRDAAQRVLRIACPPTVPA